VPIHALTLRKAVDAGFDGQGGSAASTSRGLSLEQAPATRSSTARPKDGPGLTDGDEQSDAGSAAGAQRHNAGAEQNASEVKTVRWGVARPSAIREADPIGRPTKEIAVDRDEFVADEPDRPAAATSHVRTRPGGSVGALIRPAMMADRLIHRDHGNQSGQVFGTQAIAVGCSAGWRP